MRDKNRSGRDFIALRMLQGASAVLGLGILILALWQGALLRKVSWIEPLLTFPHHAEGPEEPPEIIRIRELGDEAVDALSHVLLTKGMKESNRSSPFTEFLQWIGLGGSPRYELKDITLRTLQRLGPSASSALVAVEKLRVVDPSYPVEQTYYALSDDMEGLLMRIDALRLMDSSWEPWFYQALSYLPLTSEQRWERLTLALSPDYLKSGQGLRWALFAVANEVMWRAEQDGIEVDLDLRNEWIGRVRSMLLEMESPVQAVPPGTRPPRKLASNITVRPAAVYALWCLSPEDRGEMVDLMVADYTLAKPSRQFWHRRHILQMLTQTQERRDVIREFALKTIRESQHPPYLSRSVAAVVLVDMGEMDTSEALDDFIWMNLLGPPFFLEPLQEHAEEVRNLLQERLDQGQQDDMMRWRISWLLDQLEK